MYRGRNGNLPGIFGRSRRGHIEDLKLEEHPELGALINVSEEQVQELTARATGTLIPCPSAG